MDVYMEEIKELTAEGHVSVTIAFILIRNVTIRCGSIKLHGNFPIILSTHSQSTICCVFSISGEFMKGIQHRSKCEPDNDHHQNWPVSILQLSSQNSAALVIQRPSITRLTTNQKTDNIFLQHHTANNYTIHLMFV